MIDFAHLLSTVLEWESLQFLIWLIFEHLRAAVETDFLVLAHSEQAIFIGIANIQMIQVSLCTVPDLLIVIQPRLECPRIKCFLVL